MRGLMSTNLSVMKHSRDCRTWLAHKYYFLSSDTHLSSTDCSYQGGAASLIRYSYSDAPSRRFLGQHRWRHSGSPRGEWFSIFHFVSAMFCWSVPPLSLNFIDGACPILDLRSSYGGVWRNDPPAPCAVKRSSSVIFVDSIYLSFFRLEFIL